MNPTSKPISIQLYSLRDAAKKDFPAVLRAVAEIGYKGVEPAGFFNFTPADFRKYVEDLGMVLSSSPTPGASLDTIDQNIDVWKLLGVKYTFCSYSPQAFATLADIEKTADNARRMQEKLSRAGLSLAVHNHFWEFDEIDGRIKHEIFAELCPEVPLELDTYWAANFGKQDPVEMMRRFADRCPLLHIKNGPLVQKDATGKDAAHVAVGSGKIDVKGIIRAINPNVTEWLVVELDSSDTDMLECVRKSYDYLVGNGLASGNK